MKHISIYSSLVLAAAAVFCLTSCKKDNDGKTVALKVEFEQGAAQKIFLGDGNTVNWFSGEEININGSNYAVSNAAVNVTEASSYVAAYPATNTTMTSTGGDVTIPSVQTYAANDGKQDITAPMVAYLNASNGTLMFRNVGALLRVYVKNTSTTEAFNLDYIRVQAESNNLSGTQAVTFSGSTVTNEIGFGSQTNGSKAVRMDFSATSIAANGEGEYYIVILPLTHESALSVEVVGRMGSGARKAYSSSRFTTDGEVLNLKASYVATTRVTTENGIVVPPTYDNCPCHGVGNEYSLMIAPGNLQYNPYSQTFRFAEHQYDIVGNQTWNKKPQTTTNNWIDLFGWGTSGYSNSDIIGYNYSRVTDDFGPASPDNSGIAGTNYDWGVYNQIKSYDGNTTYMKGTWHCLSSCEYAWLFGFYGEKTFDGPTLDATYICDSKLTESNVRQGTTINRVGGYHFTNGNVNYDGTHSIYAVIIFPDGADIEVGTAPVKDNYSNTNITYADWQKMEAAGAALLPAAGYRTSPSGQDPGYEPNVLYYWTTETNSNSGYNYSTSPYRMYASTTTNGTGLWTGTQGHGAIYRSCGLAVRLARELN